MTKVFNTKLQTGSLAAILVVLAAVASLATGRARAGRPSSRHCPWTDLHAGVDTRAQYGHDGRPGDQFPPHKIVGNVYYVGTKTLARFSS